MPIFMVTGIEVFKSNPGCQGLPEFRTLQLCEREGLKQIGGPIAVCVRKKGVFCSEEGVKRSFDVCLNLL